MNVNLIIPQKWHLQMSEEIKRRMSNPKETLNNTIDKALAIDREAPYWTYAMFILSCPVCNKDIDTGARVYFIPESGFKLCRECGKKTAIYEQLTLPL